MSPRQFKRQRFLKRILWIVLTYWPAPFVKLRFDSTYSVRDQQDGKSDHGNISFDAGRLVFEKYRRPSKDGPLEEYSGELLNVRKPFRKFRKLLVRSGYFTAISNLMVDYEIPPVIHQSEEFNLTFRWAWSQKIFHSIKYSSDTWYPMDAEDRQRFETFLDYMEELISNYPKSE
jgi:hypothetical protein